MASGSAAWSSGSGGTNGSPSSPAGSPAAPEGGSLSAQGSAGGAAPSSSSSSPMSAAVGVVVGRDRAVGAAATAPWLAGGWERSPVGLALAAGGGKKARRAESSARSLAATGSMLRLRV
jgi:hypothetical protein